MRKKSAKPLLWIGIVSIVMLFAGLTSAYVVSKELTAQGIYFLGKYSNASGSFLYLIALMHLFHLFGGLFALLITLTKSIRKRYSSHDHLGIELAAIYWHFLDVLWIYLFLFLYFFR
ncbi:MAG: cytochrome c oxidase subunit 3 [Sphingobacteriaceae bacterium]|nr:cytochrome c oxidase subunit 3 [Sphingobacteriaceae bacterium]